MSSQDAKKTASDRCEQDKADNKVIVLENVHNSETVNEEEDVTNVDANVALGEEKVEFLGLRE